MPDTGNSTDANLSSLANRIKAKTEKERRTTEKMIEDSFENLSITLTASATHALGTIERAIDRETLNTKENIMRQIEMLNSGFMKHWLAIALLGLALMLGMFVGGWVLTNLAQSHINSLQSEVTTLKRQVATEKTTLRQLQTQTWGLELMETAEGRFIAPPPGMKFTTGWTVGKRPVIKVE